ncbi:FxsA cytoplasmic membrane protein [Magnetococcus marinus MC-1]|uniref:FxsA cytoplasmic membrane protein n=1 Tax=Magnetococcus marinus (strain ATCC BAA-1437 / JCM 17883 / MC-1) TaxID=156889 RepID=A0LDA4_MAGMM|nr:FxsA family protein [Magnetococcus marinus]ABK45947.1 FxsA cytoplasmic membrane protein [Magnetococcus marinus MC-1]
MRLVIIFALFSFIALEITVIAWVGEAFGGWLTFASIIGSAVVGIALVKHEGIKTLIKLQQRAEQGEIPTVQLLDGALLLFAGLLLLLPGFISDTLGFLLVFPFTRHLLRLMLAATVLGFLKNAGTFASHHTMGGNVVEGEFSREPEKPTKPPQLE